MIALTAAPLPSKLLQNKWYAIFDHVGNSNRTTQGYALDDIGVSKVVATARDIRELDPNIELELVEERFRPKLVVGGWQNAGRYHSCPSGV